MALRALIVDDNAGYLSAARALLEREGVSVVGVASSCADAVQLAAKLNPEVALVDIDLGDESGFDVARRLAGADGSVGPPVVLISAYPEGDFAELVAASPAIGFLEKSNLSAQSLLELVRKSADRAQGGG